MFPSRKVLFRTPVVGTWLIIALLSAVPVSAAAGAWVMNRGGISAKLSFVLHSTDEEFILNPRFIGPTGFDSGERLRYLFGGKSVSRAYLLDFNYGLGWNLEIEFGASYYDLQYNDDGGGRRNTGPGDMHAGVKWQGLQFPFAAALRGGIKIPTGEFDIDPERVPLSENQWDIEGAIAAGRSFYPAPVYAGAELGYRNRFENSQTRVKPGNETFFSVETGISPLESILLKLAFEGLFASERESREFGFLVKNKEGRKLLSLSPYLSYNAPSGVFIETGAKFLLAGRDYPAGTQYTASVGWRPPPGH